MNQTFTVPGTPISKHRPRTVVKNGRVRTYTPKQTKDYETDVQWEARAAKIRKLEGLVSVTLRFFGSKADLDNLVKSALDGMLGIAFNDDAQVVEIHASIERRGVPARTEITIAPLALASYYPIPRET